MDMRVLRQAKAGYAGARTCLALVLHSLADVEAADAAERQPGRGAIGLHLVAERDRRCPAHAAVDAQRGQERGRACGARGGVAGL
jgi:hypothetical protein